MKGFALGVLFAWGLVATAFVITRVVFYALTWLSQSVGRAAADTIVIAAVLSLFGGLMGYVVSATRK